MSHFAIIGSRGYPSYYGGFETLVRHLAPYLAERGHNVTVYGRDRAAGRSTVFENGVTARNTWGMESKSASTLSFGFTACVDLARRGCDAALVLNVANGFYLKKLKRAGIRTCVNVDGIEWRREKWGIVARYAFFRGARLVASHADEVIYDSEALRAIWRDEFGRDDGRFIPYGAPVTEGIGANKLLEAGLPTSGYILAVARVAPENNIDLLLDAVERVSRRTVVVVGDGNYQHPTVGRLRRLDEAGAIRWLGHVSDQELLNQLWAHAGVYWHGHSVGGTNPALLQALGAGAPTLALDTPFNREVVGRDDQLVSHDPEFLATRIEEVLESDSVANTLRDAGVRTARTRYVWEEVCGKYCTLLEELAREPGRRSQATERLGLRRSRDQVA